jgi:asparaginyl-tRNA synthetase
MDSDSFILPKYDPKIHYLELTRSNYFNAIISLRHYIKEASDFYFANILNAKNIDLFMLTPSVSSPMGKGSDSEAIEINFGKLKTNLVDSSQFGFEPLLLNNIEKVYCYLPSMRGENPDKRHLNQFFHCESEIKGDINELFPIIEGYVKILAETLILMPNILKRVSLDYEETRKALESIVGIDNFFRIEFDEVISLLIDNGYRDLVNFTSSGKDISAKGELMVANILKIKTPFFIENYDRDRVPFYQKPNPINKDKVINADLIFPALTEESFGGEIVGCGQRQDNFEEIIESLERQEIDPSPYEWYADLRKLPNYQKTSGFGLGIERFITWSLCRDDIKDVIFYPRLKNVKTFP